MKRAVMHLLCLFSVSFLFVSCNPAAPDSDSVSFTEITQPCIDMVYRGGDLKVVINSQREYDELIYNYFTKPLDEYWNSHYPSLLENLRNKYPGLTEDEYHLRAREIIYSVLPFAGTENCAHPEINFNEYTLLGTNADASGCEAPEYKMDVIRNGGEYIFIINIRTIGDCDMAILHNKWILVPKIPAGYKVSFEINIYR
jgi:hypothetical protein